MFAGLLPLSATPERACINYAVATLPAGLSSTLAVLEAKSGRDRQWATIVQTRPNGTIDSMRETLPTWENAKHRRESDRIFANLGRVLKAGGSRAPHRLYNIGNNRPEELMHLIAVLEEAKLVAGFWLRPGNSSSNESWDGRVG